MAYSASGGIYRPSCAPYAVPVDLDFSQLPFARNLRALAGLHDLNGTEMAAVLGLSRPAVSDLMTGKRQPSLPTLLRLREVFGVGSEMASDPLDVMLPQLADPERYRATLERLANLDGYPQLQRRAKREQRTLRVGNLKPSTKRGKQ
jgi:transcriptional regulator with XRE-family HTH domain